MDITINNGFLSEAVNITFAAIEVSILVAYLIVTSIYQVVISNLSNGSPDLKNRVYLISAKQKLKILRFISIASSITVLISIWAVLSNSFTLDIISLISFVLVIISFTTLLVVIINNLLKQQ